MAVMENIKTATERVYNSEHHKNYPLLLKLYDHCNLANAQRSAYNKTKQDVHRVIEDMANEKINEYERNITSQLIGLIALFTALSFVIFGGISALEGLLDNVKTLPLLKVLFVGDVWMLCMVNLFMFFVRLMYKLVKIKDISLGRHFWIMNAIMIILAVVILIIDKI